MSEIFDDMMSGLNDVGTFLSGKKAGFKVHVPDSVDVKSIRHKLHMTQSRFSEAFGFSLDSVKHWEGQRRTPEIAARAYLTVIAKAPEIVINILSVDKTARSAQASPRKRASIKSGRTRKTGKAPSKAKYIGASSAFLMVLSREGRAWPYRLRSLLYLKRFRGKRFRGKALAWWTR